MYLISRKLTGEACENAYLVFPLRQRSWTKILTFVGNSGAIWCDLVLTTVDEFIPNVKVCDSSSPAWIDSGIIHLCNKKDTVYRKVKRNGTQYLKSKLLKL